MAEYDRFSIPDAEGLEPIENIVARMRKDISSECADLLRRAKKSGSAGALRARTFETRINRIIEAQAATYSIEELKKLRKDCTVLSSELGRFES